jgi:aquaporin Z
VPNTIPYAATKPAMRSPRTHSSFNPTPNVLTSHPPSSAAKSATESIPNPARKGDSHALGKRALAEFFGTFWLVFGGCGAAVLAAGFPSFGIGFAGVALAFGLTVLTMAFAIGHVSGCHLNPAVTLGLVAGKRFAASEMLHYVIAQVLGAIAAAGVLYVIASGGPAFDVHAGFASNGYGAHSPGGYSLLAGFVAEVVLTAFFLIVIMGSTDRRAPKGFAPIAIGLCLTLIHLVSIPVTNTSVNPARSTGQAIFAGGWALGQLWMFWVAPLIGGALGGTLYGALFSEAVEPTVRSQMTTDRPILKPTA